MVFSAGLKPPESKVPVLDPYRYRQLVLDRWINRASKRLGDLASLKYGSIKEFFRVIQSIEYAVSTRIQIVRTPQSSFSYTEYIYCLLYTSPSPRDQRGSRMPSSA